MIRGMMAELATVKQYLPRSKKALPFDKTGQFDRSKWEEAGRQYGPAARIGDMVQITRVDLNDDNIVLDINGGFKGGAKWYERVEVGTGTRTMPIGGSGSNAPGGTTIEIQFHEPLKPMKASQIKKILSSILDFEKRSATELYTESLSPEMQKAIKDKRAQVGMDREQVMLALGTPERKTRETKDGLELEDWIYGRAPGKIVFVTFAGSKVTKVKELYAGLGAETAKPLPVQ